MGIPRFHLLSCLLQKRIKDQTTTWIYKKYPFVRVVRSCIDALANHELSICTTSLRYFAKILVSLTLDFKITWYPKSVPLISSVVCTYLTSSILCWYFVGYLSVYCSVFGWSTLRVCHCLLRCSHQCQPTMAQREVRNQFSSLNRDSEVFLYCRNVN